MTKIISQPKTTCGGQAHQSKESFLEPANPYSHVKKVIGVVSGKGGVGKSMVTSLLALLSKRRGFHTAILDADITGPSIPKAFHLHEKVMNTELGMLPAKSKTGISVMSLNLLTDKESDPAIWRSPIITGLIKQFWSGVLWEDVDYMFVDLPPGTGDVTLTVFQSLPLDGIVIVTSPQELVAMIVQKAINMAKIMEIPVLALVENMSYVSCPDCGKKIMIYGEGHVEQLANANNIVLSARMPIDPKLASLCDAGRIEEAEFDYLDKVFDTITKL